MCCRYRTTRTDGNWPKIARRQSWMRWGSPAEPDWLSIQALLYRSRHRPGRIDDPRVLKFRSRHGRPADGSPRAASAGGRGHSGQAARQKACRKPCPARRHASCLRPGAACTALRPVAGRRGEALVSDLADGARYWAAPTHQSVPALVVVRVSDIVGVCVDIAMSVIIQDVASFPVLELPPRRGRDLVPALPPVRAVSSIVAILGVDLPVISGQTLRVIRVHFIPAAIAVADVTPHVLIVGEVAVPNASSFVREKVVTSLAVLPGYPGAAWTPTRKPP